MREYGLDLVPALAFMTWRRFRVLVAGLSPESVCAHIVNNRPIDLSDPDDAERFFNSGA